MTATRKIAAILAADVVGFSRLKGVGESARAIDQFEEARRLSPVDPKSYFPLLGLAAAHFFAGHSRRP